MLSYSLNMIVIENLTKIFNSRKKNRCVALDNVSFVLPNKGFTFVVGKSGSGKTTLLSLIGGLDKFNSGEINVDGVNLSKLKGKHFDYYRNQTIGFIFQDFQLFEELTVYENIKLALEFINDKDNSKIEKALESVNLKGFEKRYPRELSGGEKQRVAIARVLVKNPSIILADEPTGNLDPTTTNTILNILKDISKERLVLIVSHNIYDAHKFADYILELQDGKLIGTYKRNLENTKTIEVKDGILRLPLHKELLDEEREKIINDINLGIKDIVQDDVDYKPFIFEKPAKVEHKTINKRHISFFTAFKRGIYFIKDSLKPMFIFSFITATLFSLICVSQSMREIDYQKIIDHDMTTFKNDYYYLQRDYDTKHTYNFAFDLQDDVIDKVKETGYKNDIYMSYDTPFTDTTKYFMFGIFNPKNLIICKEDFLTKRYGKFELLAEAKEQKSYGIYVTDYIVDMNNNYNVSNYKKYEDLLGLNYRPGRLSYLNGIIKTDYKTKYEKFLPLITDENLTHTSLTKDLTNIDKKLYEEFVLDQRYYLYNSFSFNENFIDDYLNSEDINYNKIKYGTFEYNGKTAITDKKGINIVQSTRENTITPAAYYLLTGNKLITNRVYTPIDPIEIQINLLSNSIDGKHYFNNYKVTIYGVSAGIYNDTGNLKLYLNPEDKNNRPIFEDAMFDSNGFIVDETADLKKMKANGCFDENIILNNGIMMAAENADRLAIIFNKIFALIIIGLVLCCIISLIFYAIYLVKSNMRMIGICKSLGSRTFDMLIILAINLFLSVFLTMFIYAGLYFVFQVIVETVLHNALINVTVYQIPNIYKILFTNFGWYFGNMVFILVLSVVSFIALFIKINKLRPLELIKSKR